jgi:uncharacterized protein YPO0396
MHRLERIVLLNWGRLPAQDVPVRGMTAILGPTGAGKSTVVDAIQLIVTGSTKPWYDLNKSTGGRNARTIRDYCLGADDHVDPERPAREDSDTLIAMQFRDSIDGRPITIGLVYRADRAEPRADVKARFVARGFALSVDDLLEEREPGRRVIPRAERMVERLRQLCPALRVHGSGIGYVDDYLHAMRSRGSAPDARQVLRNFAKSVAFEPVDDPTRFVRENILEQDDIAVDALKGSIDRYRFLEAEVRRREQQLEEIAEARRRMQVWAQYVVRHNALSFTAAHAEARRLSIETGRLEVQRAETVEERAREFQAKQNHRRSILQIDEDVLRLRGLLAEAPAGVQLRALDAEVAAARVQQEEARGAVQRRIASLARLAPLGEHLDRVPRELTDAARAVGELVALGRGKPQEALLAIDDRLAALERRVMRLLEADGSFERQAPPLARQVEEERRRLDELEHLLAGESTGQAVSPQVDRFRRRLQAEGIEARALPDLVEIRDADWALSLEMLLGAAREALIVPPSRVREAYDLLYRERREFHTCRLVDVRKTARWESRLPSGSIASVVVTTDEDARAFIERQVGRYVMAESDADLERLDQAVTRRGKTTSGMSMRVHRDLTPILGKTAQVRALAAGRSEYGELSAAHRRTIEAQQALAVARLVFAELSGEPEDALTQALGRLSTATATLRGASRARQEAGSPESAKLSAEIADLEKDKRAYADEIRLEIDPRIATLDREDVQLQVQIEGARLDAAKRRDEEDEAARREGEEPIASLLELIPDEGVIELARDRVGVAAELSPVGTDPAAALADLAAQARKDARDMPRLAEESARRGRGAYSQFVQTHVGQAPLTEPSDAAILRWCMVRERQLQEDELRQFRTKFEDARRQMEADLTEGLINRLSDKFKRAKAQIDRLNRSLAGRTFTGQTYAFSMRTNDALRPIHSLAIAIADAPRKGLSILEDADVDPKVVAGFRELERRLSDDQLVGDLRDYRRFFDFDLGMRNERGQETTLSKRSVTGSGGQKQAPYYVAVGAALASSYFPKSTGGAPDGFGLVVFDEAFNNLDAPNTRALLRFFDDLGLQVLVAAPDKVRSMFLENADTIVSVNRRPDTQTPVLTVTHPTAKAREALAAINPANLGIEHFRDPPRPAAG